MTSASNNQILSTLLPEHYVLLAPHLKRVPLRGSQVIENAGAEILDIYFPESSILSLTTTTDGGKSLDAALIGFEGMSALSLVFGNKYAVYTKIVRVAGTALKLPTSAYLSAVEKAPDLRTRLLWYVESVRYQVATGMAAVAHMQLEVRLARAALMLHDRSEGGPISITHESLAAILGATRPAISSLCTSLHERSLIRCGRRRIEILDRDGLIAMANGSYGSAEAHHIRLREELQGAAGSPVQPMGVLG